jgi:DDE superfamily endonuclease
VRFATKPALARRMLARALDAGVPASWVAGDEVYGADPKLRAFLEGRGIGYVLAVACDHPVVAGGKAWRADALLKHIPARAWQRILAGQGAKGYRYYDWAFVRLDPGQRDPPDPGQSADPDLAIRLGGIYALEQISRDSAELHWPAMEVLTAFLRESSKGLADTTSGGAKTDKLAVPS